MSKLSVFLAPIAVLLIGFASFMFLNKSDSLCSDEDYATNSCIPAGKCHPNPSIDAVIDCDVKDYDRPLSSAGVPHPPDDTSQQRDEARKLPREQCSCWNGGGSPDAYCSPIEDCI